MKVTHSVALVSILVSVAPPAFGATLNLNPTADTFTRANVTAGSAGVLDVRGFASGGDFMAYLQFDLSSIPAGSTIDSATLTLHYQPASRSDAITTGRFANFGLLNVAGNTPQDWDEATLVNTAVNAGQEYGTGSFAQLLTAVNNGWLANLDADNGAAVTETILTGAGNPQTLTGPDLVSFLSGRLASDGRVTIISAINANNDRGYGFASKENADSTQWPSLSVSYTVVPEPSALALVGLGLLGLIARRRK